MDLPNRYRLRSVRRCLYRNDTHSVYTFKLIHTRFRPLFGNPLPRQLFLLHRKRHRTGGLFRPLRRRDVPNHLPRDRSSHGCIFLAFCCSTLFPSPSAIKSGRSHPARVGASKYDVFRIFFAESLIIVGICFLLSVLSTVLFCGVINGIIIDQAGTVPARFCASASFHCSLSSPYPSPLALFPPSFPFAERRKNRPSTASAVFNEKPCDALRRRAFFISKTSFLSSTQNCGGPCYARVLSPFGIGASCCVPL